MPESLICQQVFLQIKQENQCSQLFQVMLYKRFHLIQKFILKVIKGSHTRNYFQLSKSSDNTRKTHFLV